MSKKRSKSRPTKSVPCPHCDATRGWVVWQSDGFKEDMWWRDNKIHAGTRDSITTRWAEFFQCRSCKNVIG